VHALPWFGPAEQVPRAPYCGVPPVEQRGQTLVWSEMRWTSENRLTCIGVASDTSPVWMLIFPVTGVDWKRLMTHTATPCAMSGSGGPNVAPLIDCAPTGPIMSQTGWPGAVVPASHPVRQTFSGERGSTGKLCETPVHPLSRSVPLSPTVR